VEGSQIDSAFHKWQRGFVNRLRVNRLTDPQKAFAGESQQITRKRID